MFSFSFFDRASRTLALLQLLQIIMGKKISSSTIFGIFLHPDEDSARCDILTRRRQRQAVNKARFRRQWRAASREAAVRCIWLW
jgi:hypothetical protein